MPTTTFQYLATVDRTISYPNAGGTIIVTSSSPSVGNTLSWDGNAWVAGAPSGSGWALTGNAGTVAGTNFVGTTDAVDVQIRTNSNLRFTARNAGGNLSTGALETTESFDLPNTTSSTVGVIRLNSQPAFHNYGSAIANNMFVGRFAGNFTLTVGTAVRNTGVGTSALATLANGTQNTALGVDALLQVTDGSDNTALGYTAGSGISSGSSNTLIGSRAQTTLGTASNRTALGFRAQSAVNNGLVLGSINGVNGATADALVGIGTNSPTQKLEVSNGNLLLSNSNNTSAELRIQEPSTSGLNYTAFKAQAQAADITYTLPAADGTSGQFLSTNGAGLLSWASAGAGGSVIYNTATAQNTATPLTNWLFNVQYDSTPNGVAAGARISSVGKGGSNGATGLTIDVDGPNNAVVTGLLVDATSSASSTDIRGINVTASTTGANPAQGVVVSATTSGSGLTQALTIGPTGNTPAIGGWTRYTSYLVTTSQTPADGYQVYEINGQPAGPITIPGFDVLGKHVYVLNTSGGNITLAAATMQIGNGLVAPTGTGRSLISNGVGWVPVG